jgi:hypothetical protein
MIRGLLDRIVLVGGTIAGGCVPGFIVQYRQRVGGRLDQVVADLAPFREIARQFHDGSLSALIQHHLASTDSTFHAEGQAIQSMVDAELRLRGIMEGLQGSLFDQLFYLLPHFDREIAGAVWQQHVPSFTIDLSGALMALCVGVACWLVFLAVWHSIAAAARLGSRRGQNRHATLP